MEAKLFVALDEFKIPQYRIDENGTVQRKNKNLWKNVTLKISKNGLWFENKKAIKRYLNVAEIVLTIFVKPCPPNHALEYINGNQNDVRLSNLTWSQKKRCTRCEQYKLIEDFGNRKNGKNGKSIYCKNCASLNAGSSKRLMIPKIKLSDIQKGYLSGLIDGEGWVGMTRSISKKSGNYNYVPSIVIGNTHKSILDTKEEIGVGNICFRKSKNKKHKNVFIWTLSSNPIRAILPQIIPHLKIKKKQAELICQYLELVCKANIREYRSQYFQEVDEIYSKIKELNKRGEESTVIQP